MTCDLCDLQLASDLKHSQNPDLSLHTSFNITWPSLLTHIYAKAKSKAILSGYQRVLIKHAGVCACVDMYFRLEYVKVKALCMLLLCKAFVCVCICRLCTHKHGMTMWVGGKPTKGKSRAWVVTDTWKEGKKEKERVAECETVEEGHNSLMSNTHMFISNFLL